MKIFNKKKRRDKDIKIINPSTPEEVVITELTGR
jgi:hypothetical protein